MKPYGQHRKDHGCCPGHDKFTSDKNPTRASAQKFSENNAIMRRRARRTSFRAVVANVNENEE